MQQNLKLKKKKNYLSKPPHAFFDVVYFFGVKAIIFENRYTVFGIDLFFRINFQDPPPLQPY